MEEKTDKVVGYIEYLGAGGMIGEIVPYTSVEKFKDEILDSLDCGRRPAALLPAAAQLCSGGGGRLYTG